MKTQAHTLAEAVENGWIREVRRFISKEKVNVHENDDYAICVAAQRGDDDIVKTLINAGADVNAEEGYLISYAARNGNSSTVKILIDAGADVSANNNYALYCAKKYGNKETVKVIEDYLAGKTDEE